MTWNLVRAAQALGTEPSSLEAQGSSDRIFAIA
jgi:hypothetical protein